LNDSGAGPDQYDYSSLADDSMPVRSSGSGLKVLRLAVVLMGVVVLIAAAIVVWSAIERSRVPRSVEDAELAVARAAVEESPSDLDARLELGVALFRAGQPKAALEEFELLKTVSPQMATARLNLAVTLRELGDLDGAKDEWRPGRRQGRVGRTRGVGAIRPRRLVHARPRL